MIIICFSVRHEVSHDSLVLSCSGYSAEEVFRLRSADNWSSGKVTKEGSFIRSSQQRTYEKLIKNLCLHWENFSCP